MKFIRLSDIKAFEQKQYKRFPSYEEDDVYLAVNKKPRLFDYAPPKR